MDLSTSKRPRLASRLTRSAVGTLYRSCRTLACNSPGYILRFFVLDFPGKQDPALSKRGCLCVDTSRRDLANYISFGVIINNRNAVIFVYFSFPGGVLHRKLPYPIYLQHRCNRRNVVLIWHRPNRRWTRIRRRVIPGGGGGLSSPVFVWLGGVACCKCYVTIIY